MISRELDILITNPVPVLYNDLFGCLRQSDECCELLKVVPRGIPWQRHMPSTFEEPFCGNRTPWISLFEWQTERYKLAKNWAGLKINKWKGSLEMIKCRCERESQSLPFQCAVCMCLPVSALVFTHSPKTFMFYNYDWRFLPLGMSLRMNGVHALWWPGWDCTHSAVDSTLCLCLPLSAK